MLPGSPLEILPISALSTNYFLTPSVLAPPIHCALKFCTWPTFSANDHFPLFSESCQFITSPLLVELPTYDKHPLQQQLKTISPTISSPSQKVWAKFCSWLPQRNTTVSRIRPSLFLSKCKSESLDLIIRISPCNLATQLPAQIQGLFPINLISTSVTWHLVHISSFANINLNIFYPLTSVDSFLSQTLFYFLRLKLPYNSILPTSHIRLAHLETSSVFLSLQNPHYNG